MDDGFYWATYLKTGAQTIVKVTAGEGGPWVQFIGNAAHQDLETFSSRCELSDQITPPNSADVVAAATAEKAAKDKL